MRIKAPQLSQHLQRHGLPAVCLLTGDEPLQAMECADALRALAARQGFCERTVLNVEAHFDWGALAAEANALSLFATRRVLEVRLGDKSPGEAGGKALLAYLARPPADTVLLITSGKLDAKAQKSEWAQALDRHGLVVQLEAVDAAHMPAWISARLAAKGLSADSEAVGLLAERAEGNLLAAAQEIEKLALLYADRPIGLAEVLDAVADSARFAVYGWMDTILGGDGERVVRQLHGLRAEGFEAIQVAGALAYEIRTLCQVANALRGGQPEAQVFPRYRVWPSRKALVARALKRHNLAQWYAFLKELTRIDRQVKGAASGDPWASLLRLGLRVAGVEYPGVLDLS